MKVGAGKRAVVTVLACRESGAWGLPSAGLNRTTDHRASKLGNCLAQDHRQNDHGDSSYDDNSHD
jgi:hypothetical protein